MATTTKKKYQKKRKATRTVKKARIYIQATFNNTIITFTDTQGNTLCWGSSGAAGFKGTRKHTPFAAKTAIEMVVKEAYKMGIKEVDIYVKGPGNGRDAVLRALKTASFRMNMIADVTPMAHNGPRARKRKHG
ncbi:30S ribosomal protein S11 [Patescibacteria group bacterium]|nr:30S ribosomal protein S11 [Patescibacteria group bacterium]